MWLCDQLHQQLWLISEALAHGSTAPSPASPYDFQAPLLSLAVLSQTLFAGWSGGFASSWWRGSNEVIRLVCWSFEASNSTLIVIGGGCSRHILRFPGRSDCESFSHQRWQCDIEYTCIMPECNLFMRGAAYFWLGSEGTSKRHVIWFGVDPDIFRSRHVRATLGGGSWTTPI